MGELADMAFGGDGIGFRLAWLGIIAYALQIFFDFSGYSDMAIGLARMLGFRLMENFVRPYLAVGFGEFWRRWHISLSTSIRDYLYIPLGGERVSNPASISTSGYAFSHRASGTVPRGTLCCGVPTTGCS